MKRTFFFIVIGFLLMTFLGILIVKKQVNHSEASSVIHTVMGKYPPHIVYRLQQMMKAHPFSFASQSKLCEFFMEQDSLAAMKVRQEGASALLDEYYQIPVDELQGLVSELEFSDYKWSIAPERSSLLREVVYYRNSIGLSQQKIDWLLLYSNEIEHQTSAQDFSRDSIEFQLVDSLLGKDKCITFYQLKNRVKTEQLAIKWYLRLRENNMLDTQTDSLTICNEFVDYESIRASRQDYWTRIGDKDAFQKAITQDEQKKPELLRRLEIFEKMPAGSLAREALIHKEYIRLSEKQIKSLYLVPERLEALNQEKNRIKEGFVDKRLEYSLVKKILASSQIENVLAKRFEKEISRSVENQIKILKENNLWSEAEHQSRSKEICDYLMSYRIAKVLVELEKSREHVFRKYHLENNKPAIFNTLEKLWTEKLKKYNQPVQF